GLLLQYLAYLMGFSAFSSAFSLFAERAYRWHGHAFTTREIGIAFAYSGVLGIILQGGLIGRLVRRFGERSLTAVAFATSVAGYVVLAFSPGSLVMLAVAATLVSIGNSMLRPMLTALVTM